MKPSIVLDHVSVKYRAAGEKIGTFKEYAIKLIQGKVQYKEFNALKDISFKVGEGELLGIIGRNGAGKSTLLKVISRVLIPTKGRLRLRGRVSPLIELGAGFHPELTGMENIFLNGTLLGHSYTEIRSKIKEITEFADIGGFIDSPIRTYSSGLVARLGFSISTAWTPEILIIDEVLSVGDENFRRKSAARMKEFREKGTATILVSHNLDNIKNLCTRAIWLEKGEIREEGAVKKVIHEYKKFKRPRV